MNDRIRKLLLTALSSEHDGEIVSAIKMLRKAVPDIHAFAAGLTPATAPPSSPPPPKPTRTAEAAPFRTKSYTRGYAADDDWARGMEDIMRKRKPATPHATRGNAVHNRMIMTCYARRLSLKPNDTRFIEQLFNYSDAMTQREINRLEKIYREIA